MMKKIMLILTIFLASRICLANAYLQFDNLSEARAVANRINEINGLYPYNGWCNGREVTDNAKSRTVRWCDADNLVTANVKGEIVYQVPVSPRGSQFVRAKLKPEMDTLKILHAKKLK